MLRPYPAKIFNPILQLAVIARALYRGTQYVRKRAKVSPSNLAFSCDQLPIGGQREASRF